MKKINITLYSFDDLPEDVQKQIIDQERWNIMEQCMDGFGPDYVKSLKEFEQITGTKLSNYTVGYCSYTYNFKFEYNIIYNNPTDSRKDLYAEDLSGKLLFRYINNKIMPQLTKGKYYSTNEICHSKQRHSKIFVEYDNCPLTGDCYDSDLLTPIIDYYQSWCTYSSDYSFKDLIDECYKSLFKSWHEEYKYWADDDDAVWEELHNNQYEGRMYLADGQVFNFPTLKKAI